MSLDRVSEGADDTDLRRPSISWDGSDLYLRADVEDTADGKAAEIAVPTDVHLASSDSSPSQVADYKGQPGGHSVDAGEVWAQDDAREPFLKNYSLDVDAANRAAAAGRQFGNEFRDEDWRSGSLEDRELLAHKIESEVVTSLDLARADMDIFELPSGIEGVTDRNSLIIDRDLLRHDNPREAILTIAHEYRHRWQYEVIDGARSHPLGEAGRQELIKGEVEYPQDPGMFPLDYFKNPLELDAEAFARKCYQGYNLSGKRSSI